MEAAKSQGSTGERIHDFLENPKGWAAMSVQFIIILFILLSIVLVVVEVFFEDIYAFNTPIIELLNHAILVVFTIEYILRVGTAKQKAHYATRPLNVIDFLAIFPNYIEILLNFTVDYGFMGLRAIRIIRLLRFTRFVRGLRLIKFFRTLKRALQYEGTVLQAIMPMILMGLFMKLAIWFLESRDLWISNPSLGDLFAIVGFALGIILSQKIGVSYDKFTQVQEASIRIYGNLQTLRLIINGFSPKVGSRVCGQWAKEFLGILEDEGADNYSIRPHNDALYREIAVCEKKVPDQFWSIHAQLCCDASFCLGKKVRLTPRAYDLLLHQATVMYLLLIAIFIPGFTGVVSILMATYILYGMYHLTQDLDSIIGGDYNLINIDLSEIRYFVKECEQQEKAREAHGGL
jgi:hypothetical protein